MPNNKIEDNTLEDLLWNRRWIETKTERDDKTVIFGHTASTNLAYITKNGSICIDTACVFGYQLCALVMSNENNGAIRLHYENKSELD